MSDLPLDKGKEVWYNSNMKYTAVARKKPSAPLRYLSEHNLLVGDCLDYGSGRGFDADYYGMDKYDPYKAEWSNILLGTYKRYDTIVCSYVLNVVPMEVEYEILDNIQCLLKGDGTAYISVRRDFNRFHLSAKTLQRKVVLQLESVYLKKNRFEIYRMSKKEIE